MNNATMTPAEESEQQARNEVSYRELRYRQEIVTRRLKELAFGVPTKAIRIAQNEYVREYDRIQNTLDALVDRYPHFRNIA